jgi:predicted phosphodiesterase
LREIGKIRPVTTAIVSDLHIGTKLGADLTRRPEVRARLAEAVREADQVVFLGDFIELRELPLEGALRCVRPVLADLAEPLSGKPVTFVPGNHDHRLVEPWLEQLEVDGAELALDSSGAAAELSPLAAELARALPESDVRLAYPGLHVRPDVYATHGHYLDLHLTVPRIESILSRAMARRMLGPEPSFGAPADYERAIGPLYALSYNLAQATGGTSTTASRTSNLSRVVWARVHADGHAAIAGFLLGRVAIPAGVAALNAAGLGPFSSDLSGEHLRSAGLRAMGDVIANLGVEADHVIFGHTHRQGPLPGEEDDEGWVAPSGARIWNTGSWFLESALVGDRRGKSPYWPGGVTYVHDSGAPEPVNVLREVEL